MKTEPYGTQFWYDMIISSLKTEFEVSVLYKVLRKERIAQRSTVRPY